MDPVNQPSAEELIEIGKKHLENSDYDEAIKQFDEVIKLYPDYAPGYRCRGMEAKQERQEIRQENP